MSIPSKMCALQQTSPALPVPTSWTAPQALGLVVNFPTALAALKPLGRIAPGETVLIHAAAGATGQAAVMLAKHYGTRVIGPTSLNKHETVLRRSYSTGEKVTRGPFGVAATEAKKQRVSTPE